MKRQTVTAVRVGPRHYEVNDPNNDSCPLVGPYTATSEAQARKDANEAARGLNTFYRSNWSTWVKATS